MSLLKPSVIILTAAVGVVGSNSLMLGPIATAVANSFAGAGASDVLMASAAYGLATAFSALTLAPQVDRIGAGRVAVLALLVLAAALVASAMATSVPLLIAAQLVAGLAGGAALPSIYSLSAEVADQGREAETLGVVLSGWTIALVAGASLAGPVAEYLHWRATFAGLGVFALIAATVLHIRLRGRGAPVDGKTTSPLVALQTPGIVPALIGVAAFMIAFYGIYTYLGWHVQGVLGYSTAMTGLLTLSYGIGFGLAVPLDRVIDRMGAVRMAPVLLFTLAGVYVVLALVMQSFALLIALCFVWGLVNHMAMTLIVSQLSALAPSRRGAILGLYSATTYLCVAGGVAVFRPIVEHFGLSMAAFVSALCILPAALQSLQRHRLSA